MSFMGNIGHGLNKVKKEITGQSIQESVDEYSEKYGEILLGLYRDIGEADTRISQLDNKTDELRQIVSNLEIQNQKLSRQVKFLTFIIIFAIFSGGLIWTTNS